VTETTETERALRVCYLVAYFHPFESGAERQALAQGEELVRLGHTVHVVTHAMPGVPSDEWVRGIEVHRWVRSSTRGPLFALSFVASALRALRRLRRGPGIDLIHTHQALWEGVAAGVARSGAVKGVPTVVQPAASGYYGEAEELTRTRGASVLRRLILRNDAFVAISADIERQWRALGVPAEKLVRIASGVDARHFAPGASTAGVAGLLPARPRVVFTGRLHPQKNLDVLLDAWPAVARATGASLVLVGHGDERERLEARAQALGVADRVCFTGVVPDVADVLRAADLFVLPSVAEGMSNSLLEAMATALPCVASDIGGNQDLLGSGDAGVLVADGSPERWAETLIALIADPDRRARLGAAARRQIDEVYDLRKVVARYVELYRRLLSREPRTRTTARPIGTNQE
jgi:glycosyltransferase involved in cell wall biosynthesis